MSDKLLQTLSQSGLQDSLLGSLSSLAAQEGWGLDSAVLDQALLGEEEMLEALSATTGLKPVNLNHFYPDFSLAKLLLPEWCQHNCCVPLCEEDEALHVAVGYPPRLEALDEFSLRVGRKLLPWIAIECRIQQWLSTLYGLPIPPRTAELLEKLSLSQPPPPPPPLEDEPPSPEKTTSETRHISPSKNMPSASPTPPMFLMPLPMSAPSDGEALPPHAQDTRPPPKKPTKHSGANVFRDFFVKIKQQLFSKRAELLETERAVPAEPVRETLPEAEHAAPAVTEHSTLSEVENAAPAATEHTTLSEVENAAPAATEHTTLPEVEGEVPSETEGETLLEAEKAVPPTLSSNQEHASPLPFSAVDDEFHVEALFEEFLENMRLASAEEETSDAALPQKELVPPPLPTALLEEESLKHNELPWVISFRSGSAAEPAPHWTLDEAKKQLRLAQTDRDKLTTVLLRFGLGAFEFVGLFSVIHGKAQGFSCAGKGAQEGFLRTRIDLASPGLFHSIAQTMSAYFGPPPNEPRLQRFLLDIHRRPRSIFMYPITVGDKLVALFYGDSGQNPLKQKQFSDFTLFCQQLPAAFHELLWVRRKQTLPPELDKAALQERIAQAITWLLEADVATQNAALEILGHTPEASAKALIHFFPGPQSNLLNENETSASLHTLGPIAHALLQLRSAGAQVLTPLLGSNDKKLRCAALKLAGVFASPEHLEPVLLALLDADPKVASIARAVLHHFKTLQEWPKALHRIQQSLNVKDPLRRTLAAKAVVAAKDRGSIETLIEWTGDSDAWVAETAAWALQQLSCIQLGPSPNLWKRWWARAQHERRAQWLVLALESESFEQRKQAIDELAGAIGDTFQFVADASEEERLPAVKRWRQFVAQNPNFEL